VLLDLRLSGTFFCNSGFAEPWALEIAERDFTSFHFIVRGECWLRLPTRGGSVEDVQLRPGDLVVLPRSPKQVFGSQRQDTGAPYEQLSAWRLTDSGSALRLGGAAARWQVVCGGVRLEGLVATTLVALLPELLVLRKQDASPIVGSALEAIREEADSTRPGGATLMTRLADIAVIHAIRTWVESPDQSSGWLAGLRDPQIGRVMAEVNQRPEQQWSVRRLADVANLSRSRLSQRFRELTGEPPMQYVTKVRMHRAHERLRSENASVAELAGAFGYESEPAFARAFKRHTGSTPGSVRRTPLPSVGGGQHVPPRPKPGAAHPTHADRDGQDRGGPASAAPVVVECE
jgi:AraC-like DNA-binding protein